VIVAVYEDELSWNPTSMMLNEIELRGSMGYEIGVYEQVIELMDQGHYPTTGGWSTSRGTRSWKTASSPCGAASA
jgi:hypothetical protein